MRSELLTSEDWGSESSDIKKNAEMIESINTAPPGPPTNSSSTAMTGHCELCGQTIPLLNSKDRHPEQARARTLHNTMVQNKKNKTSLLGMPMGRIKKCCPRRPQPLNWIHHKDKKTTRAEELQA